MHDKQEKKIKHGEGTKFDLPALYRELSPRTKNTLQKERLVTELHKNRHLFRMRDHVDRVYIILEGYAILERESDEHGIKSMLILQSGDLINEVILEKPVASAGLRALTDLKVVSFSRSVWLELMQRDPVLGQYVVDSMAIKIRRLYRMLEGSTKITRLDHQVASRIWKLAKDYGVRVDNTPSSYIEIPFDVRITFLASFVGSNRETVSRIIKRMSAEGILTIEHGHCKIYDIDKLNTFRLNSCK